ncbi:MAG: cytochrome c [Salinimicrobium sp.]
MRKLLLILPAAVFLSCNGGSKKGNSEASSEVMELSAETKQSVSQGAELYNNFCASCHLSSGGGIAGVFPPLKNSNWLSEERKKVIHTVKYGLQGEITVNGTEYDNLMPALGLTDAEVADILNYVFNSWGNKVGPPVTEEEVAAIEK